MKPEDAITQAMAIITPLVTRGTNIAQDVAERVLEEVVTQRLHLDRRKGFPENFRANQHNNYAVHDLPRQAMSRMPQHIDIAGAGGAQIGNHDDAISGERVAALGGSYHHGDNITTNVIKSGAGRIVALTVIAVLIFGGLIMRGGDGLLSGRGGGLDAGSACQHFPHFPQAGQGWAAGAGWHHPAGSPWQSWRPGPVRMDFPGGHDHWCRP